MNEEVCVHERVCMNVRIINEVSLDALEVCVFRLASLCARSYALGVMYACMCFSHSIKNLVLKN